MTRLFKSQIKLFLERPFLFFCAHIPGCFLLFILLAGLLHSVGGIENFLGLLVLIILSLVGFYMCVLYALLVIKLALLVIIGLVRFSEFLKASSR